MGKRTILSNRTTAEKLYILEEAYGEILADIEEKTVKLPIYESPFIDEISQYAKSGITNYSGDIYTNLPVIFIQSNILAQVDTTNENYFTVKNPMLLKGEKGEKGDTGATGAQGVKGEKGDTGERGTNDLLLNFKGMSTNTVNFSYHPNRFESTYATCQLTGQDTSGNPFSFSFLVKMKEYQTPGSVSQQIYVNDILIITLTSTTDRETASGTVTLQTSNFTFHELIVIQIVY